MNEIHSLKHQMEQLRERMLSKVTIDSALLNNYLGLEKRYRELFPQILFNFPPVTHPSKLEIWSNSEDAYNSKNNVILNRLEYMLSNFPEDVNDPELIYFWKILDRDIIAVSRRLFDDGHYEKAVLSAFIEVNNEVKYLYKKKTGKELDGYPLMTSAFSSPKPIIQLEKELTDQTSKDIQQGYMHLFAGSMLGIRNPKAHENFKIDKPRAILFISLASLLMEKIKESKELQTVTAPIN